MQSGTYPTRDLRYLRTVRVTAARLPEFYIHTHYITITSNPFNFLAPGRHQTLELVKNVSESVFLLNSTSPQIPCHYAYHLISTRSSPFSEVTSNFARVPFKIHFLQRRSIFYLSICVDLKYDKNAKIFKI